MEQGADRGGDVGDVGLLGRLAVGHVPSVVDAGNVRVVGEGLTVLGAFVLRVVLASEVLRARDDRDLAASAVAVAIDEPLLDGGRGWQPRSGARCRPHR